MLTLNVKGDVREVNQMLSDLQRRHVPAATVMALNRTGRSVLTVAKRDIAKKMALKQKEVKDLLTLTKASRNFRVASVFVSKDTRESLLYWVDEDKRNVGAFRDKRGVSYKGPAGRKTVVGSFIGTGQRGGGPMVFIRKTSKRLPIYKLTIPSVASVFRHAEIQKALDARGRERFRIEFQSALNRKLGRS